MDRRTVLKGIVASPSLAILPKFSQAEKEIFPRYDILDITIDRKHNVVRSITAGRTAKTEYPCGDYYVTQKFKWDMSVWSWYEPRHFELDAWKPYAKELTNVESWGYIGNLPNGKQGVRNYKYDYTWAEFYKSKIIEGIRLRFDCNIWSGSDDFDARLIGRIKNDEQIQQI